MFKPKVSLLRGDDSTRCGRLKPAFIQVNKLEHGLNGAGWQTDLGQAFVQTFGPLIAPAALGHETVPYFDFLLTRSPSLGESPFQQGFIAGALEGFGLEGGVIDVQKQAASP